MTTRLEWLAKATADWPLDFLATDEGGIVWRITRQENWHVLWQHPLLRTWQWTTTGGRSRTRIRWWKRFQPACTFAEELSAAMLASRIPCLKCERLRYPWEPALSCVCMNAEET
jgi:hypothetical protein